MASKSFAVALTLADGTQVSSSPLPRKMGVPARSPDAAWSSSSGPITPPVRSEIAPHRVGRLWTYSASRQAPCEKADERDAIAYEALRFELSDDRLEPCERPVEVRLVPLDGCEK
jgi:hypothetical protein